MRRTVRRLLAVIVLAVVAVLALSACNSGPSRPRAASTAADESGQPGANGDLETAPPSRVEIDKESVEKRKVLRDSQSYQYLSRPNFIEPGAKYFVSTPEGEVKGSCSFGWTVQNKDGSDVQNLTAGHCGDPGDFVLVDPSGTENPDKMVVVGKFVWQAYKKATMQTGPDYALIQFLPKFASEKYMTGVPNVTVFGDKKKTTVAGYADGEWLEQNKPYMCRLGYRSGITCGQFLKMSGDYNVTFDGITDHGDSGGVIWAFDPRDPTMQKIYAVAVTSWVDFAESADTTNGKVIAPVIQQRNLDLAG